VAADGGRLELGGTRQQVVLAMLLLSPGRMITVGRLPEAVYGAPAADGQVPSADQHLQAAAAAGRPGFTQGQG